MILTVMRHKTVSVSEAVYKIFGVLCGLEATFVFLVRNESAIISGLSKPFRFFGIDINFLERNLGLPDMVWKAPSIERCAGEPSPCDASENLNLKS